MCNCFCFLRLNFLEQRYGSNSYPKCVHVLTIGRGLEKSVLRYVRTKWISTNKCCGKFFMYWSDEVHQSVTASKENVSSIIIMIILFYVIIRIYTILHIYLLVSETEGLVQLHWVIGLSVLEKINLIYFQGISLVLSRIFFQEFKCENPNVLNIEAS